MRADLIDSKFRTEDGVVFECNGEDRDKVTDILQNSASSVEAIKELRREDIAFLAYLDHRDCNVYYHDEHDINPAMRCSFVFNYKGIHIFRSPEEAKEFIDLLKLKEDMVGIGNPLWFR